MIIPKLTLERKVLYVCKAILNFMDILSFPFENTLENLLVMLETGTH